MTTKKRKKHLWIEVILVILVLLIIVAVGVLVSTQKTLVCESTCVEDYCEGTNFYQCVAQEDGCNVHVLKGEVIGKCGLEDKVIEEPIKNEVEETPKQIQKVTKAEPQRVAKVDKCGNNEVELGETCSNCPSDIECPSGYSCLENECKQIGLFKVKGGQYCGYLRGHYNGRDTRTPTPITDYYASCEDAQSVNTGDKTYDNKVRLSENVWICTNKAGLELPQEINLKLDQERIVNRIRITQTGLRDDLNVKNLRILTSTDSTNGKDGHWLEMGCGNFVNNNMKSHLDVFTDPVSTRWVKVIIDNTWTYPVTTLGIGEITVYEASYICESDYDARLYASSSRVGECSKG